MYEQGRIIPMFTPVRYALLCAVPWKVIYNIDSEIENNSTSKKIPSIFSDGRVYHQTTDGCYEL